MIDNAESLKSELADLASLLGDIRSGTKLLNDNDNDSNNNNKKKQLNPSSSSSSSWAKSTTPRVGVKLNNDKINPCNLSSSLSVEKADKYIRKRAASYSIGNKIDIKTIESSTPSPLYYNANIESSSSYKRSKGTVFSKTTRNIDIGKKNDDNDVIINDIDKPIKPNTNDIKKITEKAYSFGKALRVNNITSSSSSSSSSSNDSNPATLYDVEKAEKYLLPNTPSLKLMKPVIDITHNNNNDDNNNNNTSSHINHELLSTRIRAPSTIIKKPTQKKLLNIISITNDDDDDGTPGPGHYHVDTSNRKKGVGRVYYNKTNVNINVILRKAWGNNTTSNNDDTPGPNHYDVLSADHYLRESRPNIIIKPDNTTIKADDKHIQRKRYWEEKANDLRETHDNMNDANDNYISNNNIITRSIVFHKEKSLHEIFENNKSLKIMKKRKEEGNNSIVYDVKHTLTEKKTSSVLVDIDKQLRSSIQYDNHRIAQIFAEKEQNIYNRDKYYGPQLPIQWVNDNNKRPKHDDDYDSDIEEVMQIIANRDPNNNLDMKTKVTSETADHYMRSIYSGTMLRSTVMMRKSQEKEAIKVAEGPQDFLGPQIPIDWTELSKGHALRMDLGKGRDEVKVHGKGLVQVIEFADGQVGDDTKIGPGGYETRFGEDAKGVVPFKLHVSRRDAVGPHGELPESAQEPLAVALDDSYYEMDMLDFDYGIAKDEAKKKRVKGLPLYQKDRYDEEKLDPGQVDHIGGTWFKGMAEEALGRKPLVDLSKMRGRDEKEEDEKILANDEEFAEVKLDIDVKDWNPRMPKPVTFKMADPESMPRFPKESDAKESAALSQLSPNRDFVKVRNTMAFIDMSKQVGRGADVEQEKLMIINEVEGEIDLLLVDQLAAEREANLKKAKEITGKLKRVPEPIDMSKNLGRDDKVKVVEEPPPITQEVRSPVQTRIKGGGDWSKQTGRDDIVDLSKFDVLLEKEELDLNTDQTASSRFKASKPAMSWDKSKSITRFEEVKRATNDLDYGDVDAGKFKKGSGSKGSANMSSKSGRGVEEEKELLRRLFPTTVLDVVPDDSAMKRSQPSSGFGKSTLSRSLLGEDEKKTTKKNPAKKKTTTDNLENENTANKKTVSFGENTEKKITDIDIGINNKNYDMASPPPTPLLSIPDSNKRSPPKKVIEGFTDATTSQMIEKLDESLRIMNIDK